MERRAAVIAALVSAACFGTLAILGRLMYARGAEPLQVLVWRFALAALLLGAFTAVARPGALRVSPRVLGSLAAASVFGYGAASLCFFFALDHADASVVAILLYTYPALVVLFELVVARALPTPGRLAAVALTFLGCVLVVDPFGGSLRVEPLGIVLGLGAGVGYASFSLLSQNVMKQTSRLVLMVYLFAFTALLAGAAALVTGSSVSASAWPTEVWLLLAVLVLVPTFAAVVLYLRAVRILGASQAAILSTFEPVFTVALAVIILGEHLSPAQWAGATAVLAGVLIAEKAGRIAEEPAM